MCHHLYAHIKLCFAVAVFAAISSLSVEYIARPYLLSAGIYLYCQHVHTYVRVQMCMYTHTTCTEDITHDTGEVASSGSPSDSDNEDRHDKTGTGRDSTK